MMTLSERLHAMAALLPQKEQARFTAPLAAGESIDDRLVEAARALAKTEGLYCLTPSEFSRALVQQAARLAMPAGKAAAADGKPGDIAARFAAIPPDKSRTKDFTFAHFPATVIFIGMQQHARHQPLTHHHEKREHLLVHLHRACPKAAAVVV